MPLPRIIDNRRKVLLEVLKEASAGHTELSIATGYWDLEAVHLLLTELRGMEKIRLLIGREPLIARHHLHTPEIDFPESDFKADLSNLKPESHYRSLVSEIKTWMSQGKLEVKVYKGNFFHAKCYIFGSYLSENAIGIIGSSNFTRNGLMGNNELNSLELDHRIVTYKPQSDEQEVGHLFWFDGFWNDRQSVNWNQEFGNLVELSPVGDVLYSPYETYIKTLYEIYADELLDDEVIANGGEKSRSLFLFQQRNAQALLRRLQKYRVAMLADSVGLGKTLTAISVLKRYVQDETGKKRVEIICPKSLVQQWSKELAQEEIYGLKPLTLQNANEIQAKRELDSIASVSLFVIDESHNLRATNGQRFNQLLDWIRANPKAHVLLLTATPINNELGDLTNQILLGTGGDAEVLKFTVTDENNQTEQRNFYQVVENLKKKINQDLKRNGSIDYEFIRQTMSSIIRAFVVRRTRQGIEKEFGYLEIDGEVKKFPKVIPEVVEYGHSKKSLALVRGVKSKLIDLSNLYQLEPIGLLASNRKLLHPLDQLEGKPIIDASSPLLENSSFYLFQLVLSLGFIPYRWRIYSVNYYGKTREEISHLQLHSEESKRLLLQLGIFGILRTIFFKRLESSSAALLTSIINYERKLLAFEAGLLAGSIVAVSDITALEAAFANDDSEDDSIEFGDLSVEEFNAKDFACDELFQDIAKEKELIRLIKLQVEILKDDDSKLKTFANLMNEIQEKNPTKKILIFSYFSDTIEYLEKNISRFSPYIRPDNSAFLSSKSRTEIEEIASRFAPKAKKHTLASDETEINYLFSTDVLSEGQNLQDAAILINYDLHWNPVRMIQRNGRVNRLGSVFDEVFVYNMKPEQALDQFLRLIQRLETRINLIRNTIGTDTPVLDETENPIEYVDSVFDIYHANARVRLAALEQAEKESDFFLTEDEFVQDLKSFNASDLLTEAYKLEIFQISAGKWCIAPKSNEVMTPRPQYFGLSKIVLESDEACAHQFVKFDDDQQTIQAIGTAEALDWLRTDAGDNERTLDRISVNKVAVRNLMDASVIKYFNEVEVGSLVGQENQILRLLYEISYSEGEINMVRAAFKTKNVFKSRELDQLKRSILKSKRASSSYEKALARLLEISLELSKAVKEEDSFRPSRSESVLFYSRSND